MNWSWRRQRSSTLADCAFESQIISEILSTKRHLVGARRQTRDKGQSKEKLVFSSCTPGRKVPYVHVCVGSVRSFSSSTAQNICLPGIIRRMLHYTALTLVWSPEASPVCHGLQPGGTALVQRGLSPVMDAILSLAAARPQTAAAGSKLCRQPSRASSDRRL